MKKDKFAATTMIFLTALIVVLGMFPTPLIDAFETIAATLF